MPTCMRCGVMVPQKEDMTLVRDESGRWITLCHPCGEAENPSVDSENETADESPEKGSPVTSAGLNVSLEEIAKKTSEEAEEASSALRSALDGLDRNETDTDSKTVTHERADIRHRSDLRLSFRQLRDDRSWDGDVKDISKGGLCFFSKRELRRGQILNLEVFSPKSPDSESSEPESETDTVMIQAPGEVRRVKKQENGTYEIGVRFVRHGRTHESNRRRYRRHYVNMIAFFCRKGSDYTTKGDVLDVSKNGARIIIDEEMMPNEEISIVLRGEEGVFIKADLVGSARCKRVVHRRAHEWEVGCEFIKIQTRPRGVPPKVDKPKTSPK